MTNNPAKILVIKSDISELATVEAYVSDLFESNNIPQKYFNKVFLCVSEAVINSIEHGNKNDADKEVSICVDCATESIFV